jgi:hypothetical protein
MNITASEFDAAFENGDAKQYLDIKSIKTRYPLQRISIDFPKNILEELDIAASKIGVTRTSLIKIWVAQQLTNQQSIA